MGRRSLLTTALLLVALITTWSAWQDQPPPPVIGPSDQRSDYVLYDFELVSLNAEGVEAFTLNAPQLRQTPGARTLELAAPTFFIPQAAQRRWQIIADNGWVSATNDEVRLRGGVVATPMHDPSGQTRIETEMLDIFPQQDLATSDAEVLLARPGATMRGTGMRAHLGHNRVELLSNIHLQHDPFSR